MKKIICNIIKGFVLFTFICLYSCNKIDTPTLEKHELQFVAVYNNMIVLYDINLNKEVSLKYNYELFEIDLITLTRIYYRMENPTFTFLCDINSNQYYKL